jgi:hypothetical protein
MTDYLALARTAAEDAYGKSAVGAALGTVQEAQDGVLSYTFASKLKGYPDWHFSVTLFIDGWAATVSEVALLPGDGSLVAPKWVPWSERLADYKALQAALEAAAAEEAEDAEDLEDADDLIDEEDSQLSDDDFDSAPVVTADAIDADADEDLAVSDVPEAVEAEDDGDSAGAKGKGLFKWKSLRGNKKRK